MTKPLVWKHDCIRHGMVDANGEGPCNPPCSEPWQVDVDWPKNGGNFATHAEAFAYALEQAK